MYLSSSLLVLFATFLSLASAQMNFFEGLFNGGGGGGHHHHQQQEEQNVASDSEWYQRTYDGARCTNYLCPGTLACVSVPHHCPCAFPAVEDKVELGEGIAVCLSKGGYKKGEVARKVELARMGKL